MHQDTSGVTQGIDEELHQNNFKNHVQSDSFELILKNKLGKVILDHKYSFNTTQLSINDILFRFKKYFTDGIQGIKVN